MTRNQRRALNPGLHAAIRFPRYALMVLLSAIYGVARLPDLIVVVAVVGAIIWAIYAAGAAIYYTIWPAPPPWYCSLPLFQGLRCP
jgi:hypothetical protein